MDELAKLFKTLSDVNRLRIFALLSERKMCVCELAFALGVTQPAVSRHLKRMKEVGLIGDEQDGHWTNYFLLGLREEHKPVLSYVREWLKQSELAKGDLLRLEKFDRFHSCRDLPE
ncbi:MAG: metalloregulator ArsR/SmtB family transcription factor [Actinomycetota bacterium]|nr:metalloregulator ArsR/SmtB family transcription factor [Actinomycetota bacterium]